MGTFACQLIENVISYIYTPKGRGVKLKQSGTGKKSLTTVFSIEHLTGLVVRLLNDPEAKTAS